MPNCCGATLGNYCAEQEKEVLKEKDEETREKLKTESKKIYDDAIEELIALVPENDRPKIRANLGEEFKSLFPNLEGFAAALIVENQTDKE